MKNDERKFEILCSIIRDYIKTAEPVGSRTIEKNYNLGISSATIRNEMADLEDMGFLVQPHTSAGRIPSDKAYRMYVNNYMKVSDVQDFVTDNIRSLYNKYIGELNKAIESTAHILTKMTNLTSLVMAPHIAEMDIKDIRLIHIEKNRVFLIIITKQGIVKNRELRLKVQTDAKQLERVTIFLNMCVDGINNNLGIDNFTGAMEALDKEEQGILAEVLVTIKSVYQQDADTKVYASGITEIFKYPEFKNTEKACKILEALHSQDLLAYLLTEAMDNGLNIKIGNENIIEELSDCSVVTATYKLNGRPIGSIGVIGPTRMDYDYCVSVIKAMTETLNKHLSETLGGKD